MSNQTKKQTNQTKSDTNGNGMSRQLVETVQGTALQKYGERDIVRELHGRIMAMHPQAPEVGAAGMMAVCQLAVMIGANPLPSMNEIHVFLHGGRIMIQIGINYYRRKAQEMGGVYWDIKPRPMTSDEEEEFNHPSHITELEWSGPSGNRKKTSVSVPAMNAICHAVRRTDYKELMAMGVGDKVAFDRAGSYGFATCTEKDRKNGRSAQWTANKRAEVDMYRQLFPHMWDFEDKAKEAFTGVNNNTNDPQIEIDGITVVDNDEYFTNLLDQMEEEEKENGKRQVELSKKSVEQLNMELGFE